MEEWTQISEAEKRKRIREALRPPASRIITDLKQDLPGATARDYFAALEAAFGTTESGEELLIQYHCMMQKEGDKPSTYLSRLQTKLRQVIRKGGISPENVNSARLRQFVKGLLFDEMLITSLHLRVAENDALGYISLLKIVRRYEEKLEGEVKALMLVGNPQTAQYPVPAPVMTPEYRQWTSGPTRHPSPNFCFRCGRTGHISRNCSNEADVQEVNRKLIKFVMGQPEQENSRGPLRGGTQGSDQ
ncbi:Paraneoplastic antigen Ma1 [Holothuria leucospilota]|uniref:Paraneoplastic antigen Ma1 n=1 Tax=Holothuria leucospilota TaxID=206669 RepID=A0A9Q0YJF7_HOLLE|nr:Paraneoplastic antigen Ma1 [Holothuria leucospilota]